MWKLRLKEVRTFLIIVVFQISNYSEIKGCFKNKIRENSTITRKFIRGSRWYVLKLSQELKSVIAHWVHFPLDNTEMHNIQICLQVCSRQKCDMFFQNKNFNLAHTSCCCHCFSIFIKY